MSNASIPVRPSLPTELSLDLDASFPVLVETYGSMVATMSARLTDPTTGEDITQEVFLRAYRALAGYQPDHIAGLDLRPWLTTITRNLVRNEYRRRARRPTFPAVVGDGHGPGEVPSPRDESWDGHGATAADPASRAEMHDELARLDDLLGRLSDAQREAVVLRHIVGLSVREIATALGCPDGTVKSHISRGIAVLREALAGDRAAGPAVRPAGSAGPSSEEGS